MSEHRLDLERRQRLGLVEAIWGEHKSAEQIIAIARDFQRAGELALVTRVDEAKAAAIGQAIPELIHHSQARCLTLGELPNPSQPAVGLLCGGSSDLPVLAEAELALPCHGIGTGVACRPQFCARAPCNPNVGSQAVCIYLFVCVGV